MDDNGFVGYGAVSFSAGWGTAIYIDDSHCRHPRFTRAVRRARRQNISFSLHFAVRSLHRFFQSYPSVSRLAAHFLPASSDGGERTPTLEFPSVMGADLIGRTGGGLGCRPYVLSHLCNSVACRRSSALGEISRIRENDEILRFILTSSGRRHDVRLRCVGYDLESWSAR